MRITSWNVNGLRRHQPLRELLARLDSDIVCLQETRVSGPSDPDLEALAFVRGYHSFFSICTKRDGYSGVATFCRKATATPFDASEGLNGSPCPAEPAFPPAPCPLGSSCHCEGLIYTGDALKSIREEGRVVITDHGHFVLINVYVPALTDKSRLPFKLRFLHALRAKVDALHATGRQVVIAGDFNICPSRRDSAEQMLAVPDSAWQFRPSRRWLSQLLTPADGDCVDTFRQSHPTRESAYTCWSEATRGRQTNFGVRIDLIIASRALFDSIVCGADVWAHVTGSDHCPVSLELNVLHDASASLRTPPKLCVQYLPRFVKRQQTLTTMMEKQQRPASRGVKRRKSDIGDHTEGSALKADASAKTKASSSLSKQLLMQKRPRRAVQTSLESFFAPSASSSVGIPAVVDAPGQPLQGGERIPGLEPRPHSTPPINKVERLKRRDTRSAWRKLLSGPPPAPSCRHGQKAVTKTVGKSGENRGRKFFSCPYPKGVGKDTSCDFFQWA